MQTKEKIQELLDKIAYHDLWGQEFVWELDPELVREAYNGIGPDFLPPTVREKVTNYLSLFEPAALIHDVRNEFSDGTQESFNSANVEFLHNCEILADAAFPWYSPARYLARRVAKILYRCVQGECGWFAWIEAQKNHLKKIALKGGGKALALLAICCAFALLGGCRYVRVTNNGPGQGWEVKYNSHWLDSKADSIEAEITTNGTVRVAMNGFTSQVSPELARFMDVTLTGAANLATKIGAAIATAGGSAGAEAVAGMVKNFISSGGDVSKAKVTCADGSCTVTDGTVTCTDGTCFKQ